jgi:quercetin dioxygenase-like cupin family protein
MAPPATRFRWDDIPLDKVTEMVARKTIPGIELELTQAYFKKGAKVPAHAHDGEMLLYVLQGVIRVTTGTDDLTLREGDVLAVPAGVVHQAEVLDDTFVLQCTRPSPPQ